MAGRDGPEGRDGKAGPDGRDVQDGQLSLEMTSRSASPASPASPGAKSPCRIRPICEGISLSLRCGEWGRSIKAGLRMLLPLRKNSMMRMKKIGMKKSGTRTIPKNGKTMMKVEEILCSNH